MKFMKIGPGLARAEDGVVVAVTGREELCVNMPDGITYSLYRESDPSTFVIHSKGIERIETDGRRTGGICSYEADKVLTYAKEGVNILTEKFVLVQ